MCVRQAHRALRTMRTSFYDEASKRVPEWIEHELNDRMLAFWFMDDGYTRVRSSRRPLAEIATNAFCSYDLQILLRGLQRLGLPAKALRRRIFFDVATTDALLRRIARFVPPPMRYKLGPDIAADVPFDARSVRRARAVEDALRPRRGRGHHRRSMAERPHLLLPRRRGNP